MRHVKNACIDAEVTIKMGELFCIDEMLIKKTHPKTDSLFCFKLLIAERIVREFLLCALSVQVVKTQ